MLFQRDYYTRAMREWNEAQDAVDAEQRNLTPAQIQENRKRKERGWEEVMKAFRDQAVQCKRRLSVAKAEAFQAAVAIADRLAEDLQLNICADIIDEKSGRIRLIGRQIIIDSAWKTDAKDRLCMLISAADDMWVEVIDCEGEKDVCMELSFDLTETVE